MGSGRRDSSGHLMGRARERERESEREHQSYARTYHSERGKRTTGRFSVRGEAPDN